MILGRFLVEKKGRGVGGGCPKHTRARSFKGKRTAKEEARSRSYRFQSGSGSGFEFKGETIDAQ